jgi:hypothetical protein
MGFALQVFAVILLFGYPGCSSINGQKELNTAKTGLVIKKTSAANANINNNKAGDSLILLHQWEPVVTKSSLVTWSHK